MFTREVLQQLYEKDELSVPAIARKLRCSQHKINYWLAKSNIQKRSISDALYKKWNPKGDPFSIRKPRKVEEGILYGLGIGLYWGEGTRADKGSVRLGNSDPMLVRVFLKFLTDLYGIDKTRLRFGLQIFGDMDKEEALRFWVRTLNVPRKRFFPGVVITPHRGVGNYKKKTKYGVLTVHFCNRKLRDILCNAIAEVAQKPM